MHFDNLQRSITSWFMRRTNNSAVRRVGELPIAVGTDIGIVRSENQDRVGVLRSQDDQGRSFIVGALCDGMGGMEAGADCASLAIASFFAGCFQNRNKPAGERILESAKFANESVYSKYRAHGGATLSAFAIDSRGEFIGVNVGDSRIYSIRKEIHQLTVDDTIAGQFDKDRIGGNHGRNELLQYIGMGKDVQPHLIEFPSSTEEALILLTTDGIHFLAKEVMQLIGNHANEPAMAVKRLIELSKWCGGNDNGSVVAAKQFFEPMPEDISKNGSNAFSLELWDAFGEIQLIDFGEAPRIKTSESASRNSVEQRSLHLESDEVKQLRSDKSDRPNKIKILKVIGLKSKRPKQKKLPLGDAAKSDDDSGKPATPKLKVKFNKFDKA
jgi:serine/threonine protein phosphatase PrpC